MARTTAAPGVVFVLAFPSCAASIDLEQHTRIVADERATCDRQTKALDAARVAAERERDELLGAKDRDALDAAGRVDALTTALAERDRRFRQGPMEGAPPGPSGLLAARARFTASGIAAELRGAALVATISADALFGSPGGTRLTHEGRRAVLAWVELVGLDSGLCIEVHVHSDDAAVEDAKESFELTGRRALEIIGALLDSGWPPSRVTMAAHGRYQPKDVAASEAARQSNRRVELWIES
ncbi:MAG: OmpA family protein [Deltaproteobacteria bacterium]|nr:OmpA family protein [Deltaproteobacteria bacterium]